jgi:hypothetical protein
MSKQPNSEVELIVCGLSATVVENLLRQGSLSAEDMICADRRSKAVLRETVLRSCLRPYASKAKP